MAVAVSPACKRRLKAADGPTHKAHTAMRTHTHAGGKLPAGLRKNQGRIYLIDCDSLRAALRLAACGRSEEDEGRCRKTWQVPPAESVSRLEVLARMHAITPSLCKSQGYYFFSACIRASVKLFKVDERRASANTSRYINFAQAFNTSPSCRNTFLGSFFGAFVGISQVVFFSWHGN